MQPRYLTLASTGASNWQLTNWHGTLPHQMGFAVISTGGSSWFVEIAMEDPTGTFPNPNLVGSVSSQTTGFTIMTGSSNQAFGLPSSFGQPFPFAAFRFTLNTQSSAGAKATLVSLQSGIG